MKILVPIKRVIDPYAKIRIKKDQSGIETQQVKMVINPFDEIALEQAIRFKEAGLATDVVVVSIGHLTVQESLRQALALGADRAIHILSDDSYCSMGMTQILLKIIEQELPDLVLMGKQSIDGEHSQIPQRLAAKLNWPQAMFASNIVVEHTTLSVTSEIDNGSETLEMNLPAVISVDLQLNQPRFVTMLGIMKAKQKPLQTIAIATLNVTLVSNMTTLAIKPPPIRNAGQVLESVASLVVKLKQAVTGL